MKPILPPSIKYCLPLICFLSILLCTTTVFAESGTTSILSGVQSMVRDILEMGSSNKVIEILTVDPTTKYPEVWSLVQGLITTVVTPVSYSVLAIYFITSLIETAIHYETLTPELIVRPGILFIAAFILVKYTPMLITTGIATGTAFAGRIAGSATAGYQTEQMTEAVMTTIRPAATGLMKALVIWFQIWIPHLGAYLIDLLIRIIAYALIIEIFVRAVLMPLSFGDIITHGLLGPGFRYFKTFVALCLQGGIMLLISMIAGHFCMGWWDGINGVGSFLAGLAKMMITEGACALLMIRSGQLCRDMVGV